ncbi:hypothetical protein CHLRE_05g233350v5 [Chlamydomonas reinhardtii]|uniref:Uncharacterized protein n=1 Tax=Chlamydomonas reinhardtii TaxID=3055 RepID=A8JG67_CHLRE|nr:uncharacterized protein CHLRE_05g233350v5 [Chlamydomonas reinhardtii]PNW83254.1 hypothetical protein CHLRE_05g233350v5 [Chlamydomonas reinhardtii]|eukprot:XP_001702215.1 hypothetical protein CHLREDRAFT_154141 [Chlamydomonas reinhardtii]
MDRAVIPVLQSLRDAPRDQLQQILGVSDIDGVYNEVDCLRVVEYLAVHKPSLDELDFGSSIDTTRSRDAAAGRLPRVLASIAASFEGLQRLVLPRLSCPVDLSCVAALSNKPHLRELVITLNTGELRLTDQGLDALGALVSLERLTLDCLDVVSSHGNPSSEESQARIRPLQLLMGTHRPPRLRYLKLANKVWYDEMAVELSYGQQEQQEEEGPEPAQGTEPPAQAPEAGPAAGGGAAGFAGISSIELHVPDQARSRLLRLAELAGLLLGALEDLGQQVIPLLSVARVLEAHDEEAAQLLQAPDAALTRLVQRCARVEVKGMVNAGRRGSPVAVTAMVQLFGPPEELKLHHGEWRLREALEAAQQPAQQQDGRAQKRQKAEGQAAGQENQPPQQQQQQEQPKVQGQALDLLTIKPQAVMREALRQLWGEALSQQQTGGYARGSGGGQRVMVMLRATKLPRPPPPVEEMYEDLQGSKWQLWLDKSLRSCLSSGGGRGDSGHRQLTEYDEAHVVVPAEKTFLLACDDERNAEQLASLLGGGGYGGGGGNQAAVLRVPWAECESCADLMEKRVLQVLISTWDRQLAARCSGGRGKRAAGGAADAAAPAGGSGTGGDRFAALGRLLTLDAGVKQLWDSVPLPQAYEFPAEELY